MREGANHHAQRYPRCSGTLQADKPAGSFEPWTPLPFAHPSAPLCGRAAADVGVSFVCISHCLGQTLFTPVHLLATCAAYREREAWVGTTMEWIDARALHTLLPRPHLRYLSAVSSVLSCHRTILQSPLLHIKYRRDACQPTQRTLIKNCPLSPLDLPSDSPALPHQI